MYIHPLPTTGAISFGDFVIASDLVAHVSHATELRARLRAQLKQHRAGDSTAQDGTVDWQRITTAVDDYLPYLFAIYNCIQTDDLILRYEPQFSWRTSLSSSPLLATQPRVVLPGIHWEIVSALLVSGVAMCNHAAATAQSLGEYEADRRLSSQHRTHNDDRLRSAADVLCRAAGVFAHLSTVVIPQWEAHAGRIDRRPPDATREVTLALSHLAMAEAQTLAIRKLLSPSLALAADTTTPGPPLPRGHPSPSLLAKLHLHVASLFDSARSLTATVGKKASSNSKSADFTSYTASMAGVPRSPAGEVEVDDDEDEEEEEEAGGAPRRGRGQSGPVDGRGRDGTGDGRSAGKKGGAVLGKLRAFASRGDSTGKRGGGGGGGLGPDGVLASSSSLAGRVNGVGVGIGVGVGGGGRRVKATSSAAAASLLLDNASDGDLVVSAPLLRYLGTMADLHRSLAYKWLGVDAGESGGRVGEGIAFLRLAKEGLENLSTSSSLLDRTKGGGAMAGGGGGGGGEKAQIKRLRTLELTSTSHWLRSYEKVNDTVLFLPIPLRGEVLQKVPAGRGVLECKPYRLPVPAFGPGSRGFEPRCGVPLSLSHCSNGGEGGGAGGHGAGGQGGGELDFHSLSIGKAREEGEGYAGAGAYY